MLAEAFAKLSPQLLDRYRALLNRELEDSPELAALHRTYAQYALRDRSMPRPVLSYFGYHAAADAVDFNDLDRIGDGLLLPQLLRDVLAIHDDIVDEDLDKFGAPPLPVALSTAAGNELTQRGKDLALYYGDFIMGVLLRVAANQKDSAARALTRLIAETLYTNQRGQLAELLVEDKPLAATTVEDVLLIGERKAAYYCYVFPFTVGALLAGHDRTLIDPVAALLVRIGTASQVIDDITGAFPGIIDNDKDTLGEIAHLRRTIPLVLLAQQKHPADVRGLLTSPPPLSDSDARELRECLWNSSVPREALAICQTLLGDINTKLYDVPVGSAASAYLHDLVTHRVVGSIERLRQAL